MRLKFGILATAILWHTHHNFTMATLNERFGINLMELRKKNRISQMELAEKSKLDLKTISNLENGVRQPVLKTIWKLANGLNVSMSKLLDF